MLVFSVGTIEVLRWKKKPAAAKKPAKPPVT